MFLCQLEHTELESIVSQSQLRFPENQDVWLKDLASYINLKLEKVPDSDPIFKDKPKGIKIPNSDPIFKDKPKGTKIPNSDPMFKDKGIKIPNSDPMFKDKPKLKVLKSPLT